MIDALEAALQLLAEGGFRIGLSLPPKSNKAARKNFGELLHKQYEFVRHLDPGEGGINTGFIVRPMAHPPGGGGQLFVKESEFAENEEAASNIGKVMGVNGVNVKSVHIPDHHPFHQYLGGNGYLGMNHAVAQRWVNFRELAGTFLDQLSPQQQIDVFKHHGHSFVIGDHDAHGGNVGLAGAGLGAEPQVVGIDKGFAFNFGGTQGRNRQPSALSDPQKGSRYLEHVLSAYIDRTRSTHFQYVSDAVREWAKQVAETPDDDFHNAVAAVKQLPGGYGVVAHEMDPGTTMHHPRYDIDVVGEVIRRKNRLPQVMGALMDHIHQGIFEREQKERQRRKSQRRQSRGS